MAMAGSGFPYVGRRSWLLSREILSFLFGKRPESDGMYGTDVVAGETVRASAVPCRPAPVVEDDIFHGTGAHALTATRAVRRRAEVAVARQEEVEERAQDIALYPCCFAGTDVRDGALTAPDARGYVSGSFACRVDFLLDKCRSVGVESWQGYVGVWHLYGPCRVQTQSSGTE